MAGIFRNGCWIAFVPLAETSTGVGQQGFLVTLEGEAPITAACVDCGNITSGFLLKTVVVALYFSG